MPDFEPLNGRSGEICCVAKNVPPQLQPNAASATWSNFNVGKVRTLLVRSQCSERTVWNWCLMAALNGRFGEIRFTAKSATLRLRTNAASATCPNTNVGKVRVV
jgi:hypothetical protein